MKLRFWGVRGSLPAPGAATARTGGNTSCLEVRALGRLLILDMGSGARALGAALAGEAPLRAEIFLSHLHHDHTQGLPYFAPCLDPAARLGLHLPAGTGADLEALFAPPYFPRALRGLGAALDFRPLEAGRVLELGAGLSLRCEALPHPGGCLGFRVEAREGGRAKVLAYCTDAELGDSPPDCALELARGADALVCDAQYRDGELLGRRGWGHSSPRQAAALARAAGAARLLLTHHDPGRGDDEVESMEAQARELFPAAQAAREGLELEF